jgi:chromosome partitioning protein
MAIIGVGGEKGGSGKTSLATNVAAYLASKNNTVGLLDADPKPAASGWAERRKINRPDLPPIEFKRGRGDIDDTIRAMGEKYDHLIIDCGGMNGREMRHSIMNSTIFLVPFMPSIYDTATALKVDEHVGNGLAFNKELKTYAVIMAMANNRLSIIAQETRDELKRLKYLTLLDKGIFQLEEWRHTAKEGIGVIEGRNEKAKNDITLIIKIV